MGMKNGFRISDVGFRMLKRTATFINPKSEIRLVALSQEGNDTFCVHGVPYMVIINIVPGSHSSVGKERR
jgi:hypothetical protein